MTHEVLMNTDKIDEFVNNCHKFSINKLMIIFVKKKLPKNREPMIKKLFY